MVLKTLIAECTAYDFKLMLEEKKPKSWLKSVSAFANGLGGSLFFGIDNECVVRGLDNVQHVCEVISTKIRDYMDPLPEVEMLPQRIGNLDILQLKVSTGNYTPYYYVGDGQRVAFVRVGDESLPATAEQMVRLEVHLDIYDDRLTVTSPGGMYNGMLIQDLDIADVSSERRNPILANVMAQLNYMEKRGSGLIRICNETKALEGYKDELKPKFKSTPTQFQTVIFASSDTPNVGSHDGNVSETKLTERQQKILFLVKESPTISGRQMSEILSVSQRTIERDLSTMQKNGILKHEGKDNDGCWQILITME